MGEEAGGSRGFQSGQGGGAIGEIISPIRAPPVQGPSRALCIYFLLNPPTILPGSFYYLLHPCWGQRWGGGRKQTQQRPKVMEPGSGEAGMPSQALSQAFAPSPSSASNQRLKPGQGLHCPAPSPSTRTPAPPVSQSCWTSGAGASWLRVTLCLEDTSALQPLGSPLLCQAELGASVQSRAGASCSLPPSSPNLGAGRQACLRKGRGLWVPCIKRSESTYFIAGDRSQDINYSGRAALKAF